MPAGAQNPQGGYEETGKEKKGVLLLPCAKIFKLSHPISFAYYYAKNSITEANSSCSDDR